MAGPPTGQVPSPASASRALAASLLVLLVTGMLLLRHDIRPSTRAIVVGGHIILGLATAIFGLRSLLGLFRMRVREFPVGVGLVLVSGVLLLVFGAKRDFALLVATHALIATAYAVSQLVPRRLAYLGAPALGLLLASMSHDRTTFAPPVLEPVVPTAPRDQEPRGLLDASALGPDDAVRFTDVGRCATCHPHVSKEHAVSAHRHASITNPLYLQAVRATLDEHGEGTVAGCASCHDVGLVVHDRLLEGIRQGPAIAASGPPGLDVGVPCLACHGATEIRSQHGDGALALKLPDDPVVLADGVRHTLSFWVTYVDPRSHRGQMMPRDGRSSTRCGTCHQGGPHPTTTTAPTDASALARLTGRHDDRDVHRASAFFPGSGVLGRLPVGRGPRSCASCHMGPEGGGHRVAAAHLGAAVSRGDGGAEAAITAFLKQPPRVVAAEEPATAVDDEDDDGVRPELRAPWSVSWLKVTRPPRPGGDPALPGGPVPAVAALDGLFAWPEGAPIELHLLVTNEGVGHRLPGGTTLATRFVVDVEVTDGSGAVVGRAAGVRLLDDHQAILPGHGRILRFAVPSPPAELRVRAKLLLSEPDGNVSVVLADTGRDPALRAPLRLARYADAAADLGDDPVAEAALTQAELTAPGDLEVRLARSRFLLDRRGDPMQAARLLGNDDDPRARTLRARGILLGGRPQEALPALQDLLEAFPEDPGLLRLVAEAQRQAGAREEALGTLEALLARRPDDRGAVTSALALARELGRADLAAAYAEELARVAAPPPAAAPGPLQGPGGGLDRLELHRLSPAP